MQTAPAAQPDVQSLDRDVRRRYAGAGVPTSVGTGPAWLGRGRKIAVMPRLFISAAVCRGSLADAPNALVAMIDDGGLDGGDNVGGTATPIDPARIARTSNDVYADAGNGREFDLQGGGVPWRTAAF